MKFLKIKIKKGWGEPLFFLAAGLLITLASFAIVLRPAHALEFDAPVLEFNFDGVLDCAGGEHFTHMNVEPDVDSVMIFQWQVEGSGIECGQYNITVNGDEPQLIATNHLLDASWQVWAANVNGGEANDVALHYAGTGRKIIYAYSVIDNVGIYPPLLNATSTMGSDVSPQEMSMNNTAPAVASYGITNFLTFGVNHGGMDTLSGYENQVELLNVIDSYDQSIYQGLRVATTSGDAILGVEYGAGSKDFYMTQFSLIRSAATSSFTGMYPFNFNFGAISCCAGTNCEVPVSYNLYANGSVVNIGPECYGQEWASSTINITRTNDENALVIPYTSPIMATGTATSTSMCYWGTYWDAVVGEEKEFESDGHILNVMEFDSDYCKMPDILEERWNTICAGIDTGSITGAIECAGRRVFAYLFWISTTTNANLQNAYIQFGNVCPLSLKNQVLNTMEENITSSSPALIKIHVPEPYKKGSITYQKITIMSSSTILAAIGEENFNNTRMFLKVALALACIGWVIFRFFYHE